MDLKKCPTGVLCFQVEKNEDYKKIVISGIFFAFCLCAFGFFYE